MLSGHVILLFVLIVPTPIFNVDTSRIPNPAWNLTMSYVEDTRVGFFANFFLNISWLSPLGERFVCDKSGL